jgi:drug/metabolite transporter (DMT)-like permease
MDGPAYDLRQRRVATAMLLFSCVLWGGSFAWQKNGGNAINAAAGLPETHALGQILLMMWRFVIAVALWSAIFPRSWKGWTWQTVHRSAVLGAVFGTGMLLQAAGLARTSAGLSAFLTSLTIIFVPLSMTLGFRKPPPLVMWIGVAIATLGIHLMTGDAPGGFDLGALLGLGCAIVFSAYLILLNHYSTGESPWRLAVGQNLTVMLVSLLSAAIFYPQFLSPSVVLSALHPPALQNMLLLVIFSTTIAAGIMVFFQPRVDPTRAAMIYLTEPIFASGFAYLLINEKMTPKAMVGGALILLANLLAELWEMWGKQKPDGGQPSRAQV